MLLRCRTSRCLDLKPEFLKDNWLAKEVTDLKTLFEEEAKTKKPLQILDGYKRKIQNVPN